MSGTNPFQRMNSSVESLVQTSKLIKKIKILNSNILFFFNGKDSRPYALNDEQKGFLKYVQSNENYIFWKFEHYRMSKIVFLSYCCTVYTCVKVDVLDVFL